MIVSILFFSIFLSLCWFVFSPLINNTGDFTLISDDEQVAIEIYKKNLYKQIREVEFEKEMGILTEEDFQYVKQGLISEAGELMDIKMENPVSQKIGKCPECKTELYDRNKYCSGCGLELSYCSSCGSVTLPTDSFCSKCGKKVKV